MDISVFFSPVDSFEAEPDYLQLKSTLGHVIRLYHDEEKFPDLSDIHVALIGVPEERGAVYNEGCAFAPDAVRKKLYRLRQSNVSYRVADLGNLKTGHSLNDTYSALSTIIAELLKMEIIPVIIGGSQDLTYAQYIAYQQSEQSVNIVAIDSVFDLGMSDDQLTSQTYLGKIILHEPNFLFNFSNIGYQTYLTGSESIELMDKLFFDTYRLGQVRSDLTEVEPIVRNADIMSFDISAVRQPDAPGNGNAGPNGFSGEEACQIVRYAGLSEKITSIGFYEVNPKFDRQDQTIHLVAQMIWYFIEGFYNRKQDYPLTSRSGFIKYRVALKNSEHEIVFLKSKRSERWWMEIPYPNSKMKQQRHHLVPCSYADYETACSEELPERWWQAFQKLS